MSKNFSQPRVSVNIPCYNSQEYIRETLDSVIKQTFTDLEIIIIDDGSKDNTSKIINKLNDKRIKYYYKNNAGLSHARNDAISLSKGEFIAFLDHDDIWHQEKLSKQLDLMESSSDIGLVYSDSLILSNSKILNKTYFQKTNPKRGDVFEDLLFDESNFIPLSSVLVRREVFEKCGLFSENFTIGEELEIFLRIAQFYKFDYIGQPLITYRLHSGNLSHNKEKFLSEIFDIFDYWKNAKPKIFEANKARFQKKVSVIYSEMGNYYALLPNRSKAIENFKLSQKNRWSLNTKIKELILTFFGNAGYKAIHNIRHEN